MTPAVILMSLFAGLSVLLLLWLLERLGGKTTRVSGVVTGRRQTAAGQSLILAGKVLVPIPVPARFLLQVRGPSGTVQLPTDRATYERVADGEALEYYERRGWFTKKVYVS